MSLTVEMLEEKNMAKLTIEVAKEEFEGALEKAYQKRKGSLTVQGFRKGKAPRNIIEKFYGEEVFYEDAANIVMPEAYDKELKECDLDIVSQPDIDVVQIGKNKAFIFTATVAVKPEVELGDYKKIKVEKTEIEVTEEEITKKIDLAREQNARIVSVERPAKKGDIAVIDFEGFIDDVAFEGGKGTDHELELGSGSFIDNFEDQIVDKNVNDKFDVNVTFPENYQAKELAGKPAVFKVELKEIKEKQLPELDEEFVQDVSEFDTVDEYKADIEKSIKEAKTNEAKVQKEEAVMKAVIENAKMDIPKAMKETQEKQLVEDFSRRLQGSGLTLEQYIQFTGMDKKKFMESISEQAIKRIQSRLVLEAIVKAENIEVSEEEYEDGLKKMAETYKTEVDNIKNMLTDKDIESIKLDLAVQKAVDLVVEAAVEE